MGKQAENIINKKANMVFAEARRTNRMVPQPLKNSSENASCLLWK